MARPCLVQINRVAGDARYSHEKAYPSRRPIIGTHADTREAIRLAEVQRPGHGGASRCWRLCSSDKASCCASFYALVDILQTTVGIMR